MADTDDDIDKTENLPQDPPSSTVVIDEIKDASEEAVTSEITGSEVEVAEKLSESKVDAEEKSKPLIDGSNVVIKPKEKPSYVKVDDEEDERVVEYESAEFDYVYDWQEDRDDDDNDEKSGENYPELGLNLFYNKEDYVSGAKRVKRGTVPMNILEFHHSYAYDCRRHFNLCVADANTIIFASGNLIHFYNIPDKKIWFRRGSTGGGIGHIVKNPMQNHVAIGENGIDPPIIIYEWPTMEIVRILKRGTKRSYAHLAYSPDGRLLVSQGGEPDYMITVWNWGKALVMLRCKSHGQDIYNVTFSPSVPGHLTSSGSGHIKFWKMAKTFTGLKLKGELGRFGKTEISDIVGVYPMPDEKVVSGCEWGNILLWDEGLIKLEVCKTARKTCHEKLITQFEYNNGELMSVGMDGWIRIWFYETIDQADPPDDDRFIEIEPIYEFEITEDGPDGDRSMLMCIQKKEPEDPEDTFWYAQDGNGGLWIIDICTSEIPNPPKKIFACHAGPILDMSVSTWGPFVATFARNAHLHIYNYVTKKLILIYKFRDVGSQVAWLPCSVEATGSTLICAFGSGVIRVIIVAVEIADKKTNVKSDCVRLLQAIKPHSSPITAMSTNESKSLLITGGEDATVFVLRIQKTESYPILIPIGYVKVPSSPTCFTWKPSEPTTVFIGCLDGDCVEVKFPSDSVNYTSVTYELVNCELRVFKFASVKSAIRRELFHLDLQKKKADKIAVKMKQMEKIITDNPGIEIDEEAFLMDSEDDPPYPEIYIPEIPNRVLFASYTNSDTIWLSMAGFDAGYMYEYPVPDTCDNGITKPCRSTMIADADDTEINSYIFYNDKRYLILGMEHGEIRVCRVNPYDHTDLSDYWLLPMHDNYNGRIPKILLSHDRKILLTCGYDGNLFSYLINDDEEYVESSFNPEIPAQAFALPATDVDDIEELSHPSLEQVIVRTEYNRIMADAKRKKSEVLDVLSSLGGTYAKILDRNRDLIKSQQIPHDEFELDPRITADLNKHLDEKMELVRRKLAFKVEKSKLRLRKLMNHFIEPITCLPFEVCKILAPDSSVKSLRERKLDDTFLNAYAEVERRIKERDNAGRHADVKAEEEERETVEKQKVLGIESFLKGLSPSTIQYRLGVKVNQMLRKYRARKARFEERQMEWKAMYANKPDPNVNHPDDLSAIEHANNTIGDYKLKTSANFSGSEKQKDNTLNKYKQFLDARARAHKMREGFNDKLRKIRGEKEKLLNDVNEAVQRLKNIHAEIPEDRIKPVPIVPQMNYDLEFPERNLEFERYVPMAEKVREAKRTRKGFATEIVRNPEDEEHELLLMDEKTVQLERETSLTVLFMKMPEKRYRAQSVLTLDIMQSLVTGDKVETPWEKELKRGRIARKIYEQDCILEHIQDSYKTLDQSLDKLERERLEIITDSVYMELFILTLHQELIILKDFEAMENMLTDKVAEKSKEMVIAKSKVQGMSAKIEQKNKDIVKLHSKIKELITEFMSIISENKFHDYLKRIFKKKYKPPKTDDESSSSSSTSDSSSDEDDAGSIDSREMGPIHLDENVCPAGCEQEIYLAAFSMREKRYECEFQIKEEQKYIENLRKEIESDMKKTKVIENALKINKEELQIFMQEKQRKLNDIDMTVILKLHQLQNFKDENTMEKICNCVVFDNSKLTSLYARVGELKEETDEQKAKHRKNRMHLQRMNVDCKHMEAEIHRLKSNIRQEMIKKFGREVSLNTLYEAVLRRMIYDIKIGLTEMVPAFESQIKCIKDKYAEEIKIFECVVQDNTEKLSFLTVLEEEQLKLKKILKHVPVSEEEMLRIDTEYRIDLTKFDKILKSQEEQKELLTKEIKNLRLKSRPLPPINCQAKIKLDSKIKTIKEIGKDVVAVIDVETGEGVAAELIEPQEEWEAEEEDEAESEDDRKSGFEVEGSPDGKEEEEDEIPQRLEEYHDENTATMIRHLLSRIIEESFGEEEEEEEGGGGVGKYVLKEVMANLPVIGGSLEEFRSGIERSIENIIASLPQRDDKDNVEAMRQAIREIINEIVYRLDSETKMIRTIPQETIGLLENLLNDVGIGEETIATLKESLISLLLAGGGATAATDLLLNHLPRDISDEMHENIEKEAAAVFAKFCETISHSRTRDSDHLEHSLETEEPDERKAQETSDSTEEKLATKRDEEKD